MESMLSKFYTANDLNIKRLSFLPIFFFTLTTSQEQWSYFKTNDFALAIEIDEGSKIGLLESKQKTIFFNLLLPFFITFGNYNFGDSTWKANDVDTHFRDRDFIGDINQSINRTVWDY